MKELIDVRFKILGYIKFLEYMRMWEEIDFLYSQQDCYYYKLDNCRYNLPYKWIKEKLFVHYKEGTDTMYQFTLEEYILDQIDTKPLEEFSEYLEKTYDFLPRWEELNEYLYKLAIINP